VFVKISRSSSKKVNTQCSLACWFLFQDHFKNAFMKNYYKSKALFAIFWVHDLNCFCLKIAYSFKYLFFFCLFERTFLESQWRTRTKSTLLAFYHWLYQVIRERVCRQVQQKTFLFVNNNSPMGYLYLLQKVTFNIKLTKLEAYYFILPIAKSVLICLFVKKSTRKLAS